MRTVVAVGCVLLVIGLDSAASAAPTFDIETLGFTDFEHTSSGGDRLSSASDLNEAGQVLGTSRRYNGGSTQLGQSVWLYDGTSTLNIGLTDGNHTFSDGTRFSTPRGLNQAGQAVGQSNRSIGTVSGRPSVSAWLYNGATTVLIGLVGNEHTNNTGGKSSIVFQLNEFGQAIGNSIRFDGGSTPLGLSTWFYNGASSINIGLVGIEHTSNHEVKTSLPIELNEAGQVAGYSLRYNGGIELGRSAWRYDGTTTSDIGLVGSEHTRDDDYKYSSPVALNEAGHVGGFSERFDGGAPVGRSAWRYDGATTIDVGLVGSEHTRDDDYKYSSPTQLNESGQVAGFSERYNGGILPLGSSAWLYNGTETIDIGLVGSEHTASDDSKFSGPTELNGAGQVIGHSSRYDGILPLGSSAWLYDGATTRQIGLVDSGYTRNDGYRLSIAEMLNEAGQVVGQSSRFDGSTQLGQDAWFYDAGLDQIFPLHLSARSDGYAYSTVDYLGEDGLVLGTYHLFDALDNSL